MQKKRRIMIIGAGITQVPAILSAKKMGLEVVTIDKDSKAPGFHYADKHYVISTIDIEAAVAKAREIKPDGVMTLASDMPVRTVAAIAKELGLNAVSEDTAVNTTNKGKMRICLQEKGITVPRFYVAGSFSEYMDSVKKFRGRFIVKPADNSASRGVFLADGDCNLKELYQYSRGYSRSGEVVVEEYMPGPEVSVETLTVNGETHVVAVTDKLTTGAPYFVEMGHSIPSILPERTKDAVKNAACAAVRAIGIDKGPSHTEIIVAGDGPKIVEIGARLGGDCITTHLVPMATGVNMVECCIKIALGDEPDILPKYLKGSALRYFKSFEGHIVSIEGVEDAGELKGVEDIVFEKNVGDMVTAIHNSDDRVGFVIARADTQTEAVEICNKAIGMININVVS